VVISIIELDTPTKNQDPPDANDLQPVANRTHDKLNRLTVMANTPQSGLPVSFAYQYNDANQRIRTVLADGSYWVYEYDEQGQVISGRRFWADHTPVAGQQFDYAFDDIGNRQTTLAGGDQTGGNQRSASYTADRLNRYSARTVPATFDVLGLATATSAVSLKLNDATTYTDAYRKGEYFRKELTDANTSAAKWSKVEVMVSGASTVTGNVWVPQTPEAFTYDNDGNLLTDGRWTYTWDAENRLVKQEAHAGVPAGARLKLEYEYDHQGRRIRKAVSTWNGSAWTLYQVRKFVYDGWNLIADLYDNDTLRVQFMWGTDLSGSFQGAGGVGGLVKIYDHASSKTYFPGYDGNGNIAVLVDGDSGVAGAVYEYGPFGELIRSSGVYAATNPFRFSTKYQDKETDLLYYGYRYYNPSTGRWLNRDPVLEHAFRRLTLQSILASAQLRMSHVGLSSEYRMVNNDTQNKIDVLGLDIAEDAYVLLDAIEWALSTGGCLAQCFLLDLTDEELNAFVDEFLSQQSDAIRDVLLLYLRDKSEKAGGRLLALVNVIRLALVGIPQGGGLVGGGVHKIAEMM
jgi:RHS repeat-associated protein